MDKINIAFIKFGGLSAGGTEKFLQTIAANLDKDKFNVDYYYCDSAPYVDSEYRHADTDINRLNYLVEHGVNLIKFDVDAKDIRKYTHDWLGTNFFNLFNESKYDLIQTGRAGHPEYPFNLIKKVPIVDSIHILGGVDSQFNISRVMHITNWSSDKWIGMGGDKKRVEIVSHPIEINANLSNLRDKLDLNGKFIYGFHQRSDDSIFSDIPLMSYKEIEDNSTAFLIMGGSNLYARQAESLGIKSFLQLKHSAISQDIYDFLQTLDVYSHGRKDGELNSTAMAEAMFFGLPIVSHKSSVANGHIECIADAGKVVETLEEYVGELRKLRDDNSYYSMRSLNAKKRFSENYDLSDQINRIVEIYEDVIKNPFPNKIRRIYFELVNRMRYVLHNRLVIYFYRKWKKIFRK